MCYSELKGPRVGNLALAGCVLEQATLITGFKIPRKWWVCPDIKKKFFTGTFNQTTNILPVVLVKFPRSIGSVLMSLKIVDWNNKRRT